MPAVPARPPLARRLVSGLPILLTALLQLANLAHLHRMWTTQTAAGHSVLGWCLVNAALCGWAVYYRVEIPDKPIPFYATLVGIAINGSVILSVLYFRGLA